MRLFSLLLLACWPLAGPAAAEPPTLRIATGDYAPYTGATLADDGIVNARVRQIAEAAGMRASFDYLPWTRALETTRAGQYDASSYWYFSDEREQDFIHVGPVVEERLVFVVRNDSPLRDWSELSDLAGLRIGMVSGYTYTEPLWDLAANGTLTLSEAPNEEANLRKLLAGRVDIVPISELAGWHLIQSVMSDDDQARLVQLDTPIEVTAGYILVPRSLPSATDLARTLQAAVDSEQVARTN